MGDSRSAAVDDERDRQHERHRLNLIERGQRIINFGPYVVGTMMEELEEKIQALIDSDIPRKKGEHEDLEEMLEILAELDNE